MSSRKHALRTPGTLTPASADPAAIVSPEEPGLDDMLRRQLAPDPAEAFLTPTGRVTASVLRTHVHYDHLPLLISLKDEDGQLYLACNLGSPVKTEATDAFLVVPVSQMELLAVLRGDAELRAVMNRPDAVVLGLGTGVMGSSMRFARLANPSGPNKPIDLAVLLPAAGARITDATGLEDLSWLPAMAPASAEEQAEELAEAEKAFRAQQAEKAAARAEFASRNGVRRSGRFQVPALGWKISWAVSETFWGSADADGLQHRALLQLGLLTDPSAPREAGVERSVLRLIVGRLAVWFARR
jgi:hypothetical protein